MAIYPLVEVQNDSGLVKYTFTGIAAAAGLNDQTAWFDLPANAYEIEAISVETKSATTESITCSFSASNDGGATVFPIPVGVTGAPNVVTNAPTAASAVMALYVGFDSGYRSIKPQQMRLTFLASASTETTAITRGTIIIRKK